MAGRSITHLNDKTKTRGKRMPELLTSGERDDGKQTTVVKGDILRTLSKIIYSYNSDGALGNYSCQIN